MGIVNHDGIVLGVYLLGTCVVGVLKCAFCFPHWTSFSIPPLSSWLSNFPYNKFINDTIPSCFFIELDISTDYTYLGCGIVEPTIFRLIIIPNKDTFLIFVINVVYQTKRTWGFFKLKLPKNIHKHSRRKLILLSLVTS